MIHQMRLSVVVVALGTFPIFWFVLENSYLVGMSAPKKNIFIPPNSQQTPSRPLPPPHPPGRPPPSWDFPQETLPPPFPAPRTPPPLSKKKIQNVHSIVRAPKKGQSRNMQYYLAIFSLSLPFLLIGSACKDKTPMSAALLHLRASREPQNGFT